MMSRDLTTAMRQEQLKSCMGCGIFVPAIFLVVALASPAQAQRFDDAVNRALFGSLTPTLPPAGPACSNPVPGGNLATRICNNAGAPGASGGSTTTLSREVSPVEDRKVQQLIGPINMYVSGEYERFDKNVTRFEPGYKTNTGRALIGADYSFDDRFVVGAAFKYSHDDGKFNSQPAPIPRGRFDTNSYGGLLHASFVPVPKSFIDAIAGYTRKDYFIRRGLALSGGGPDVDATGTADGDTDGNEYKVEVNGGYNFSFQNITIGPRLGLNYKRTDIDGFRERGRLITGDLIPGAPPGTGLELVYRRQHETSLTSVLGMFGSIAISTAFGVLVPQTSLEYVHEFEDPQRKIKFRFAEDLARERFTFENDPPDRNYFNLGAGIVLVLPHGISPFVNYRSLVGYKDQSSHTVTAGLRVEF